MLRCLNGLESNEGNLHGAEQANNEEGVVGHVNPLRISVHQQKDEHVEGDQVDDKDVAAPSGHLKRIGRLIRFFKRSAVTFSHHVKVGEGSPCGPVDGASLDGLDPQEVGEHESEDGNALVVIGPSDRPVRDTIGLKT